MELDLQSLHGLHVHSCTYCLRPRNPQPPPLPPHLDSYTNESAIGQPIKGTLYFAILFLRKRKINKDIIVHVYFLHICPFIFFVFSKERANV
jgi:hypothetical protein